MIEQFLYTIFLTILTVSLHAFYSIYAIHELRKHYRKNMILNHPVRLAFYLQVKHVVLLLLVHCLETSLWAAFYTYKKGLPDYATALYFSIVSYATIGYGDVVLPSSLRLVGATEGIVGTLMAGWSVAILVGIMQILLKIQRESHSSSH